MSITRSGSAFRDREGERQGEEHPQRGDDFSVEGSPNTSLSSDQMFQLEMERLKSQEREKERQHELNLRKLELELRLSDGPRREEPQPNVRNEHSDNDKMFRLVREALPKLVLSKENINGVFKMIESAFDHYEVPASQRAQMLLSLIGNQVENLFVICDSEQLKIYEELKRAILHEFRLSPGEYQQRFVNLRKAENLTYNQFGHQLQGILALYLEGRGIRTLEEVQELLVADQFKKCLRANTLKHVLTLEGENWFKIDKLCKITENFENSFQACSMVKNQSKSQDHMEKRPELAKYSQRSGARTNLGNDGGNDNRGDYRQYKGNPENRRDTRNNNRTEEVKTCFHCKSTGHFRNKCPILFGDGTRNGDRAGHNINCVRAQTGQSGISANILLARNLDPWGNLENVSPTLHTNVLEHRTIYIGNKRMDAIIDSGAETMVVKTPEIDPEHARTLGKITLRDAFDRTIDGTLVQIPVSLVEGDPNPLLITAAATASLCAPAVLTPHIYQLLQETDPSSKVGANLGFRIDGGDEEEIVDRVIEDFGRDKSIEASSVRQGENEVGAEDQRGGRLNVCTANNIVGAPPDEEDTSLSGPLEPKPTAGAEEENRLECGFGYRCSGFKMGTRIYIGRLSYDVRERDLEKLFKGYGRIREILIKNGFGFVEFDDYRDADNAVYELNGKELLGERINIEHARGSPTGKDQWGRRNHGWKAPTQNRCRQGGGRGRYGPSTRTEYRLVVENISSRVSWQDLKDYMRQAGEVTYADAHKQRRNEGVVEFASYSDMKNAIDKLDDTDLNGRRIKLIEDI